MRNGMWKILEHGVISIDVDDGTLYTPSAKEIFFSEFMSVFPLEGVNLCKPSTDLSLSFSKFPLALKMVIQQVNENDNSYIESRLICKNKGIIIPVDYDLSFKDYIIIDNAWFPFDPDNINEILHIKSKLGIMADGKLTLKQYLYMRKNPLSVLEENIGNTFDTKSFLSTKEVTIPYFSGTLFPYQIQGYKWLNMISHEDAGCILADEMGLGKTVQIIALLANEKHIHNKTSLVIAPVTLMENWRREIMKFAPELSSLVHQGNQRTGYYQNLIQYDLIITTYETILRDLSMFQMVEWNIVVIDEAQAIKNPDAQRTKAIKLLNRRTSIAVTGTPIENRLTDLWSIMDFAFPGYLGELIEFKSNFPEDETSALQLEPIISPLMLRRRVLEVAGDLPERIDAPQVLEFSTREAEIYEVLRQDIVNEYGRNSQLIALTKLRIFCCHPLLHNKSGEDPIKYSKYQRLVEIIEEIIVTKEKLIIFTTYTGMTDIMTKDLSLRFKVYCDFIDGRVPVTERQHKIDSFSNHNGSAILILNPKAAGVGLNITAANHVIHYNLEWNPAVEDQASARSFRRGQTRPVTVHRLYIANTVEEVINDRVERKRILADHAVVGTDGSMDQTDILRALTQSPFERSNH